jgi:hypothetical protein
MNTLKINNTTDNRKKKRKKGLKKVVPGFEPGSLDSKSSVLTVTPYNQKTDTELPGAGFEPARCNQQRILSPPP